MSETIQRPRKFVIRQLAATFDGARIAAGEFRCHVQIWDLREAKRIAEFETELDFGGMRLAISRDGRRCVAGSYEQGIFCYDAETGREIWRRVDLLHVQRIRAARSGTQLLCGFETEAFAVLNLESGKSQRELRGVHDLWESYYEPVRIFDRRKKPFELVGEDEKVFARIERKTFAALSHVFAPGKVCISESGGPVSCYSTADGAPLWTYKPGAGVHALKVGYREDTNTFYAVTWPYQRGGERKFVTFAAETGEAEVLQVLGSAREICPCSRGNVLLSSEGELLDTATGLATGMLDFFPSSG